MNSANNLLEQVWESEVGERAALIHDAISGLTNMHARLRQQGAPPALIERIFDIRAELNKSLEALVDLRPCFPKKPDWYR